MSALVHYTQHRIMPFKRQCHIFVGESVESIMASSLYLECPHRHPNTDLGNGKGAHAMLTFHEEKNRPLLLFTREGFTPGVASHEALHALCMVLSGMFVPSGKCLDTPLTADTNEVWAYCIEDLVDAIVSAVANYDAALKADEGSGI